MCFIDRLQVIKRLKMQFKKVFCYISAQLGQPLGFVPFWLECFKDQS